MTIIIAGMTTEGPRMVCDTLLTSSDGSRDNCDHKVFCPTRGFLVGVAGDLGFVNLIRLQVDYTGLAEKNMESWIHTKFMPQVKALGAFIRSVEGKRPDSPQVGFLSRSGAMYEVQNTDCIQHHVYMAIGSGAEYAKGCLWAGRERLGVTKRFPYPVELEEATECAIGLSSFCGGEVKVHKL